MSVKNVIKDNYNMMLLNDYLREKIKDAGFAGMDMAKTPTGTRVSLHVTRPGIVIGRKGSGIKELTSVLAERFGLKDPQITVVEIENPGLSPNVMCNRIATHISRGIAFRRATMWTLKQIMDSGAMGVQITVSGKLRGDRSAFEKHTQGILPRAGHHAEVVVIEDVAHVKTPMGLIGVRIRIALKEKVIPEFEMIKPKVEKKPATEKTVDEKAATEEPVADGSEKATEQAPVGPETATAEEPTPVGPETATAEEPTPVGPETATAGEPAADGSEAQKDTSEEPKARTESEQIAIEEEKMKSLETLEEEEHKLK